MSKNTNTVLVEEFGTQPMLIQITTDATIHGDKDFIDLVKKETRHVLGRFAADMMSVDIHFTDENGAKHGNADKRCLIEARCSGRPPVAVSDESATVEGSFHGAIKKMQQLLENGTGKTGTHSQDADRHRHVSHERLAKQRGAFEHAETKE